MFMSFEIRDMTVSGKRDNFAQNEKQRMQWNENQINISFGSKNIRN